MPSDELTASISIRPSTRDAIRSLKRGDQTYDELFREMIRDFEPDPPDPAEALEGEA